MVEAAYQFGAGMSSDCTNSGECACYVSVHILKMVRYLTGSQWRDFVEQTHYRRPQIGTSQGPRRRIQCRDFGKGAN